MKKGGANELELKRRTKKTSVTKETKDEKKNVRETNVPLPITANNTSNCTSKR